VTADAYRRNIRIGDRVGRLEIRPLRSGNELMLEVDFPDSKALLPITARVRRLFDLDSDPREISSAFRADPLLGPLVGRRPGLRVPGAWDGFELAIRAILGQQITVKGATTLSGRLVEEYGRRVEGGFVFPRPKDLAHARFTRVGLPKTRAAALRSLAGACARGDLRLEPGNDVGVTTACLMSLPGVGDWTAQYIAMRALGEPDAFPSTDLGLLKAAGQLTGQAGTAVRPARLRDIAESWRPWRAYGAMHLWQSLC
jgi:AraC family transcriptional regulator of adaptative response / DNA-3-methyladenine glycosylase II